MNKFCKYIVYGAMTAIMAGCAVTTVTPTYTSSNPDMMRIGGDKPGDKEAETINMGSYCLQVTEKWKMDGKTPDGQSIWTKDSYRKVIPCR